ncbi:MAG: transglutaminase domain-containing protein [Planctomycetota bacterium]
MKKIILAVQLLFFLTSMACVARGQEPVGSDKLIDTAAEPTGVTFGEPVKAKWRVGAVVRGRGQRQSVLVTLPIPNDWPEQTVALDKEELPDAVRTIIDYRQLKTNNVRQMIAKVPNLPANNPITIAVTVAVETREIIEPEDKSPYVIPKSNHKEGKIHLGVSPYANHRNSKLRNFTKKLVTESKNDWEKAEAIYNWIRDNVEHEDGDVKNAVTAFQDKKGCNEDKAFLFVAMCRSIKIPARIVFANQFTYAEFMLTDAEGKASYWFPANINGVYEFGSLAEPKIILQKGDNIKVPEKKQRQKYIAEHISVTGTAAPKFGAFREQLEPDEEDQ